MNPLICAAVCKVHLLFPVNIPIDINCVLVACLLDGTSGFDGIELPL